jgi:hypothetical protein
MSTVVPTHDTPASASTRHEDLVLQVYCCVLATLGGQIRMYQWLANNEADLQRESNKNETRSLRDLLPVVFASVSVALSALAITASVVKSMEGLAKPFDLGQGIVKEGQNVYGNFSQADRTEEHANAERAQMFYQKFTRDESTADEEGKRMLQAISEVVRKELEAMGLMGR